MISWIAAHQAALLAGAGWLLSELLPRITDRRVSSVLELVLRAVQALSTRTGSDKLSANSAAVSEPQKGSAMNLLYQLLFAIVGFALRRYDPAGLDAKAISTDLEVLLASKEGPNAPKWLAPVQEWAVPFLVDSVLQFLTKSGILAKLNESVTGLEPSPPPAASSPAA